MPWVQIQKSSEATWDDYQAVQEKLGNDVPEGLIYHAAGEAEGGRWQAVSIWESEADYNRFRDERILPAVQGSLGEDMAQAGPPPTESFEAKHVMKP